MTNKLVVITNSLKIPKIKKILLYEIKFLIQNYSCFQVRGLPLPDPCSLCPLSSTEFVEPPRKKFLGTPLIITSSLHLFFGRPLVLTPTGSQSVIFLTNFMPIILVRCLHLFFFFLKNTLNDIFSFYELPQFLITSYSPYFLTLNWSKYLS